MKNIKKDIKDKKFKPFYLIYGDENYLLNYYKMEFKKCFNESADMNVTVYNKDSYEDKNFIATLQKVPFFADKKLIVLDNLKLDNEKVFDIMLENNDVNVVLYVLNGDIDKRTKLYNFFKDNGYVADMNVQDDETLIKFIKGKFLEENKNISTKDASYLIQCAGNHLDNIINEKEKLVAYVGSRENITNDDIDKVVTKSLNDRVFSMIKFINKGDFNKAYNVYGDLILSDTSSNNAIVDSIIGLLKYNYNLILSFISLKRKSVSVNDIKKTLSISDFQFRDLVDAEKKHDMKYFIDKIHKLHEYNKKIRNDNIDKNAVIELLLY